MSRGYPWRVNGLWFEPKWLRSGLNPKKTRSNQQSGPSKSRQQEPLIPPCAPISPIALRLSPKSEFMFPHSQDSPPGAAEGAGDEPVAGFVAGDLGPPELRVGLGLRGVIWAPVTETQRSAEPLPLRDLPSKIVIAGCCC